MELATVTKIRALAVHVGIGYGTLMKIARECDENAALPSLAHMTRRGLDQLYQVLVGIRLGSCEKARMMVVG
jgi:hypothetical protein